MYHTPVQSFMTLHDAKRIALEKLLDGPCYHMFECTVRPDFQKWIDAYAGNPDWKGIFTHPDGDRFYKATVDYPACGMYKDPKCKVAVQAKTRIRAHKRRRESSQGDYIWICFVPHLSDEGF